MAVRVPAPNWVVTALTATWPPNWMLSPVLASTGALGADMSALDGDRHRHLRSRDLAHQFEQVPLAGGRLLHLELVLGLHRLVVFLAESHLALGGVEVHAFHRRDQLLGI